MAGDDDDDDDEVVQRPATSGAPLRPVSLPRVPETLLEKNQRKKAATKARRAAKATAGSTSAPPPLPLTATLPVFGAKAARKPSKAVVAAVAAAEGAKLSRSGRTLKPSMRLSFD